MFNHNFQIGDLVHYYVVIQPKGPREQILGVIVDIQANLQHVLVYWFNGIGIQKTHSLYIGKLNANNRMNDT